MHGRNGPENEFRLCFLRQRFEITCPTESEGEEEDDIDRLEKEISQGHMGVVFLGPKLIFPDEYEEVLSEEDGSEEIAWEEICMGRVLNLVCDSTNLGYETLRILVYISLSHQFESRDLTKSRAY